MADNYGRGESIQFAAINVAADGELVAAVSGKKIRVISYLIVAAAAETVTFESDGTPISGVIPLSANGGVSYAGGLEAPAFETAAGESLDIDLGATESVDGHLAYVLVS